MAVDIGPKIGLQGESEFRKQISQVNTQIKTLGAEMKMTEAAFAGQEKSTEALTSKSRILRDEIEKQTAKIDLLSKGLQESATKYGENDEKTQKWQQAVYNAQTELSKMERELQSTTTELNKEAEGADKAGKETKESGDEAKSAEGNWKALGDTVAAVGAAMAAAAAAAAAAIVEAGKALASFTVDAAGYADDVLTMSTVTGMSTEKLQELQYAADLVDVSVDTITGSMKKNLSSMTKAQGGSKDMTAAYQQLGVAVTDSDGKLRNSETVYWELINALGQVDDETERDALAMQVLGKSATDLNPLIEAGADKMGELADEAHAAGYVMSEDTLEAFGNFDDQLQRLDKGTTAAKNALGTILLPMLSDLAGEGVDLLGEFTNGILDANGDISKMDDVISKVLPKLLDKVMQYVPQVLDVIVSILSAVGQSILDNLDLIISSIVTLMSEVLAGILDALPDIISATVTLITTMAETVIANLPTIIEAAIEVIVAIVEGLAEAMPKLIPAMVDAVMLITETMLNHLDLIINAAMQLIIALAEGLIAALPRLIARAPEIIASLVTAVIKAAPQLLLAAGELILTLATGIVNALGTLIQKGRDIVDSVKQGFHEKVEAAKTWGSDLISNFISGITEKWQALKNSVASIAQTVRDFIGFSEPKDGPLSNFHTYAPDMIDLFIKGLRDGEGRLQKQLEQTLDPAGMTAGVADVTVGGVGGMAVTIPLNIDGQTLTRVIAQIQWAQGTASVRNYGASLG